MNFSEILTKKIIHENASEIIVCEIVDILSRGDNLTGAW